MQTKITKFIKTTLISAVFAVLAAGTCFAQSNDGGGRLGGTWDAVVTIRVCATGAPLFSFASTGSFNQGGTFSGITSAPPPPGSAARSSERGVWSHVSGNQYRFRFKAYLFNAAGMAIGYQVITHDLELDEKSLNYTSGGTSQTFDMTGIPTGSGCSTSVGTRMTLD